MALTHEEERQGLLLLSRCCQKPGRWLTERLSSGQLAASVQAFFPSPVLTEPDTCAKQSQLASFLAHIAAYEGMDPDHLQKILSAQYHQWTQHEAQTLLHSRHLSPFIETQDPLRSYRHLPGQEIMEWYHCCGMKIPARFIGRPDSLHMKLEFSIYLKGMVCQQPKETDYEQIYDAFLRRFLLPHMDQLLGQYSQTSPIPFYYDLCSLIRTYLF